MGFDVTLSISVALFQGFNECAAVGRNQINKKRRKCILNRAVQLSEKCLVPHYPRCFFCMIRITSSVDSIITTATGSTIHTFCTKPASR